MAVILYGILARNTKPITPQAADHTHSLNYLCSGYRVMHIPASTEARIPSWVMNQHALVNGLFSTHTAVRKQQLLKDSDVGGEVPENSY